jgi:uncharacterized delta-60 repeat protein
MKIYILIFFAFISIIIYGQPGHKDNSFIFPGSFNQEQVKTIVIQPDGKILVGGYFVYGNYKGILRINQDGTIDNSFEVGTSFNSWVNTIALLDDGKILVGGNFTSYNGVTSNRIVRLNPDGSIDNTFNDGNGFNNEVFTIVVDTNHLFYKILVGGIFATYNQEQSPRLIRLNSDGTRDNTFFTYPSNPIDNAVNTIKVQSDGNVLVGGAFSSYGGTTANKLTRLLPGGFRDNSFNIGTGFNNNVYTIEIQSDGKILVGGSFTNYSGVTKNRIARLHTNGTLDSNFEPLYDEFNNTVSSIAIQSDGKILVGGSFNNYNGNETNFFVRLESNADVDETFNAGNSGFSFNVNDIAIQSDGKILVIGAFWSYNGSGAGQIIRLFAECETIYMIDNQTSCESFIWSNGVTYSENTNTPTQNLTSIYGCDSLVTLNLTILNSTSSIENLNACNEYNWNGNTYTSSGTYTDHLLNSQGCDSTAILNLVIYPTSGSESITTCESHSWNGNTYTSSGSYTTTLTNILGCDSTATLNLTINQPTSGSESLYACAPYSWNGQNLSLSGTYTANLTNANGCDSLATLNLTILNTSSSSESATACQSYSWHGNTYSSSGSYNTTLTNANGCDSIINLSSIVKLKFRLT